MLSKDYQISPKLRGLLNDHMFKEFYSAYLYLSIAHHFKINGMKGCACWFDLQSKEEYAHAMKFLNLFQQLRIDPSFNGIPQLETNWNGFNCTKINMFSLEHEQSITKSINELLSAAQSEGKPVVCNFLQFFVEEQLEEENKFIDIYELSKSLASNLTKFDEILMKKSHQGK